MADQIIVETIHGNYERKTISYNDSCNTFITKGTLRVNNVVDTTDDTFSCDIKVNKRSKSHLCFTKVNRHLAVSNTTSYFTTTLFAYHQYVKQSVNNLYLKY